MSGKRLPVNCCPNKENTALALIKQIKNQTKKNPPNPHFSMFLNCFQANFLFKNFVLNSGSVWDDNYLKLHLILFLQKTRVDAGATELIELLYISFL